MRVLQFIAVAGLALAYALIPAHAEKRIALVIGNNSYANLPANEQLLKAVNDARGVGAALTRIQFDVMSGENLGRSALVDKLDAFIQRLSAGDTAFFFFSGHGVALGGVNYILPSDIPNIGENQESRLAHDALSEQDVVADLKSRGVRVAIVVLDACRTNPFGRPGGKGVGFARGLAAPPQVQGVFSLYAAAAGQSALDRLSDDDSNPNSVFSRVLVPRLTKPGLDLRDLAYEVREEVARIAATAGYDQRPASYDETIGGRIYLAGPPPGGHVSTPDGDAAQAWHDIQGTMSLAVLDDFIARFGDAPIYGPRARERREEVVREQRRNPVAVAAAPDTPAAPSQLGGSLTAAQEDASKHANDQKRPSDVVSINEIGQFGSSRWDHNGSVVYLTAEGASRRFYYDAPRAGLDAVGVKRGTLLFEGRKEGDRYSGVAYLFSQKCGPRAYAVSGPVASDQSEITITLSGQAPRLDGNCNQVGFRNDTLVFSYKASTAN